MTILGVPDIVVVKAVDVALELASIHVDVQNEQS
jgi:hypothetical protein